MVFVVFLAIMVVFGVFMYRSTARTMKEQLGNKCLGIAEAVAVFIEEDIQGYRQFIDTLDTESDYYINTKAALEKIRYANSENIRFLYTEVRNGEDGMMYVLDGEREGDVLYSPPGSTDALTVTRRIAYTDGTSLVGDFTVNKYGTLLSAYAAVEDPATGELVGLVGVDVSKDQYDAVIHNQLYVLFGCILLLVLMVAVTLVFSSAKVEKLIVMDSLTGTYNKSYFLRALKEPLRQMRKKSAPLTVIMADLDHFKNVNDTYGHPFGDVVLESVAASIGAVLRKSDCLARYGGEEFAAFMPGLGTDMAAEVAERIRMKVEQTPIHNEELDEDIYVTISIGVALAAEGQSAADVIAVADKALYLAKRTRNAVYCAWNKLEEAPQGHTA